MPPTEAAIAMSRFDSLLEQARPILVRQIRHTLWKHRTQLERIARWLVPASCDILATARFGGMEDSYTELIGWLLWPDGVPQLALKVQRGWLKSLGCSHYAAK